MLGRPEKNKTKQNTLLTQSLLQSLETLRRCTFIGDQEQSKFKIKIKQFFVLNQGFYGKVQSRTPASRVGPHGKLFFHSSLTQQTFIMSWLCVKHWFIWWRIRSCYKKQICEEIDFNSGYCNKGSTLALEIRISSGRRINKLQMGRLLTWQARSSQLSEWGDIFLWG